jgi:hypothetical protein
MVMWEEGGGPGVREWRRGGAGAFLVGVAPTGLQFDGMTKTQTVRVVGFALIVIGAALFLAAHRRHHSDLSRYHRSRRDQNRPAGYDWSRPAPSQPDLSRHDRTYHGRTYHGRTYHGQTYHGRTYHGQTYHDHIRREQSTRGPSWRDESRDGLPELIHRPEKPDLRNWIRRA